ncbi:hypothetical protein RJ639_009170 [Escallonia herrerae]|uniref:DUF659 domain-containing protein n=1 Tax=Escallonia herrerae TaxID=1293975 RepID=A0AA88VTN5_9ASTE|nr:hypothetical protein RJ639_009170 [Escallonia herrerae]
MPSKAEDATSQAAKDGHSGTAPEPYTLLPWCVHELRPNFFYKVKIPTETSFVVLCAEVQSPNNWETYSTGNIAFVPKQRRKGVSSVTECEVVQRGSPGMALYAEGTCTTTKSSIRLAWVGGYVEMSYSQPDSSDPAWKYSFWPKATDKNCLEWVSFNIVRLRSFAQALEVFGIYGVGLRPLTYHELKAQRSYSNYNKFHGESMVVAIMLDKVVEEIGGEHVVQVVSQNGSTYMKAGKLLMQKRKCLIYASCVSHSINLILSDFAELPVQNPFVVNLFMVLATSLTRLYNARKEGECNYEAAFVACLEITTRNLNEEDAILTQIDAYKNQRDLFAKGSTIRLRSKKSQLNGGTPLAMELQS